MAESNAAPKGWPVSRMAVLAWFLYCIPFVAIGLGYWLSGRWDRETKSQVHDLLLRQQEAWNAGDLEGFMTDYWDSEDLTFFSAGTVEKGHAALLTRYRKRYQSEGKEMGTLSFSELEITPMGTSDALARGRWKVVTSKDSFDGLFTLALRRFADGWKITHDHTSQTEKKP